MNELVKRLRAEMQEELETNILPLWMARMVDNVRGGLHGRIDGAGNLYAEAPKGAILNAPLL